MTKPSVCKNCEEEVPAFHIICYEDLSGWCSQECFVEWTEREAKKAKEAEDENARRGIRIIK